MDDKTKYNSPLDSNGNPYWVPIVVKDKGYLIGFLDSMCISSQVTDIDYNILLFTLSSDRFNDILQSGERISSMSDEKFKDHIKKLLLTDDEDSKLKENNSEFSSDILGEYYLPLNCTCGNFHGFNTPYDLPDENFKCDICGKTVIEYTHKDDDEFIYDGEYIDVQAVVNDVRDELNGEEE